MQDKIDDLVTQLGNLLKEKHISLSCAESCTGGGLAFFISKNPASSSILERGFVTYSGVSKEEMLGVKRITLDTHGAVSKEVAIEMAEGALEHSNAQLSVALTGIAGCDINEKESEGLVWIACVSANKKISTNLEKIKGDREKFIYHSISAALHFLIKHHN